MASLDQTIKIILRAVDETGGGFKSASDGIGVLTDKVGDITGPLASMTDTIITVDAALLALAATMTAAAINAAEKFDVGFREIATLVKTPIEGMNDFRDAILDYASTSTQSLDSVIKATYNAISAGVDQEDSLYAVMAAEKLAVAGKAELNGSLEGLVGTLNAYGVGLDEAEAYSDVFFTTVRLGKTTVPELNASLARVTGTATLGHVPFATLGAAIATLTAAGAPTSEAVTKINSALNAIIKPSSQAAELAKDLGIEFNAQALQSKGLEGVLQEVAKATGGSADKMAVLFGSTEALQAVNVLAVTSGEKFRDNLKEMQNASGATIGAFDKMKGATSNLGAAIEVAFVKFGDPLLEQFRATRSATADLAIEFGKAAKSGAFEELQDVINALLKSVEESILTIAENLPAALEMIDWSGITDAMGDLGDAFGGLFEGLDLKSPEGLAKAIQAIVDTGETLIRVTAGIVDGLTPFVQGLAAVVTEVNASDDASKRWAGEILGIAKGINTLIPALGAMGDGLGAVGTGLQALAAVKVVEALTGMGSAAVSTAAKLAGQAGLVGAAAAAGYAAGTVLNDGLTAVVETATGTKGATLGTWLYDITHASEEMAITAPTVATAMEQQADATDALATAVEIAAPAMDGMTTSQFEAVVAAEQAAEATGVLTDDTEKLTTATGRVVSIFRDAEGNIVGYGDGLTGIASKASTAAEKTKTMTKETDNFRLKMEEIASNERIKTIEAKISLDIATLETDTKRVEAAFDSIDTSITSTGNLLSSLFDNLIEAGSMSDKWAILDQIELENELRKQSFELQQKLAEAEIARIEAQIRAMERGDTAIQIDGTGLEPELEAFMWAILKKIRVKANAQFQDYLLGMAA